VWLCLGVVLVRLTYVRHPLRTDEGGYLLIARQWHSGGEFLYGDYYVDRPPLLMLIFRVAALTEWDPMIRVISIPFVLLFVLSAWRAGQLLAGPAGARWAAVVAAALMCSPALSADQADGELFAASLVMASIALCLSAWRAGSARWQLALAFGAGLLGSAAALAKQNFLDGLLFAAVLVVASAWTLHRVGSREAGVAAGVMLGALVPHVLVWLWAITSGADVSHLWRDLAEFRGSAFEVIWSNRPRAAVVRGLSLLALGFASGLLAIVVCWLAALRPRRVRVTPAHWAITVVLLFGLASIAAGGSYWLHYLIQLAPGAALAAGALAPAATRAGRWMRVSAWTAVGATLLGAVLITVSYAFTTIGWFQHRTGEWLAASSATGDTVYVVYGQAAVLETAGMDSPYPYLWSLPMRTLDPDQERLRSTVAGAGAPTWIVEMNSLNSWGIDEDSRLRDLVEDRYRVVAEICGNPVWLLEDQTRELAPAPAC
jgi:hypothetical protein